jgi:putative addiction module killer protein
MYFFQQTSDFRIWMEKLKDEKLRDAIAERLGYAQRGKLGKPLQGTNGIAEFSIDYGPGYRVYYCRMGVVLYLLLCAGSKKDQTQDIEKAKAIRKREGLL